MGRNVTVHAEARLLTRLDFFSIFFVFLNLLIGYDGGMAEKASLVIVGAFYMELIRIT
jgi:hypothetical protein